MCHHRHIDYILDYFFIDRDNILSKSHHINSGKHGVYNWIVSSFNTTSCVCLVTQSHAASNLTHFRIAKVPEQDCTVITTNKVAVLQRAFNVVTTAFVLAPKPKCRCGSKAGTPHIEHMHLFVETFYLERHEYTNFKE
jgi:hypothetical protein